MLLDLEQFRQSVIQKLEAKNLKFDDNERMMLDIDVELRHQFYDVLKADPTLFTPSLIGVVENIENYENDMMEDRELLIAYGKASIANGEYSIVFEIREYIGEEEAKDVVNYFLELIEDSSKIVSKGYISSEVIELVLDYGKTDFLYSITSCRDLNASTITKLKEFAKTVDKVPDFLAEKYQELDFDYSKYSVIGLLKIFNKMTGCDDYFDNWDTKEYDREEAQQLYQFICERLVSGEYFDLEVAKENINTSFIKFDESNKRNLIEALIKLFGVNPTIMLSISYDFETYEDLIVDNITENAEIGSSHFYNSQLQQSQKILEKLLEFGLLEEAISFTAFPNYIPMIIEKITSGDPIYKNIVVQNSHGFKTYLELFKLLLERDMIKSVSFDENDFWYNNSMIEVVLNEIKKGREITLSDGCYAIKGFLETVVKSRNFATLQKTNINQLENAKLSEEAINILIEELKTNLILADKILLSARSLIFQNQQLLNFYLQSNGYFIEKVINRINHEESLAHLYNEDTYNLVKGYYAEKYSLNLKHLDLISRKFGMQVIRYLDNENIHHLVNLSEEEFDKFMDLFPDDKMTLSDLANIYDSLMQYKFSKEHPEVVNIFADIKHSLEDKDNIYIKKLEDLYSVLNDKFYEKFAERYPDLIEHFKNDPKQFLLELAKRIQNKSDSYDKDIEMLHFITNYYIAHKREKYREEYNMYAEPSLSIPYDLDENDLEKKLVEICLRSDIYKKEIIWKLVELGLNQELANKCVLYFLSKKDKTSKEKDVEVRILDGAKIIFSLEEVKQIKPYLRQLSLVSKEYAKIMPNRQTHIYILDRDGQVERNYRMPDNLPDIYQLLTAMNAGALKHTLANPEAYQSLLQTMHKYRIHHLPNGFKEILESEHIGISGDYSNLSGFISYYDKIYESERSRLESQGKLVSNLMLKPANIFIYSDVYSSVSSVYSQILGSKDAKLIKANPRDNQATRKTEGNTRLNEAVEWTISNFTRMTVTVPAFAEDVPLESGKAMHAVVGNFTNPANVTHGERTGACMRIGGVGETLFQFCLENENGFHIRFENPETGEYISRVSGFRNGNTVFLNELRNSCNSEDYSDDEVVEACRRVAELLIEKSKNSTCPIENVVVHTAYAVDKTKYAKTDLGVSSIKTGLPGFYSDVSTSAHILATSSTTSKFVPLDFDKSQVPTYLPAREKAKESTNLKDLIDMINRVSGVKAVLAGQPLESIEPVIVDDSFIYGIASQDWYIYIDGNLEIHEDIINIDERAKEELAVARKRVEEMLPVVEKQQAYSY